MVDDRNTLRIGMTALQLLATIVQDHGKETAMLIWEQAEADAFSAGETFIDTPRLQRALTEYRSQE